MNKSCNEFPAETGYYWVAGLTNLPFVVKLSEGDDGWEIYSLGCNFAVKQKEWDGMNIQWTAIPFPEDMFKEAENVGAND